ncbi:MAG: ATP-binding protein [Actinomycetota bacterium]|nr:ATP-binding protein [Actinomycetota bacterium]
MAVNKRPLADKASLSSIRKAIRADLAKAEADPSLAFDCLVAVTEACTNALLHGHHRTDDPPPEILWEVDGAAARFYIQDYSTQQWSKTSHPSRDAVADLEERIGGYGLDLMRGLMDEVDIQMGPEGTTVCLVKSLAEAKAI